MDMLISLIVMIATGVAVWLAAPYHAKLFSKRESAGGVGLVRRGE